MFSWERSHLTREGNTTCGTRHSPTGSFRFSACWFPDIVVMHFGTNDVWSSVSPDRILAAYTRLVGQMRASNPDMNKIAARWYPALSALLGRVPATRVTPVTLVTQVTGRAPRPSVPSTSGRAATRAR